MRQEIDRFEAIDQLVSSFSYLFSGFRDCVADGGVIAMVYGELSMHGDQRFARATLT